MPQTEMWTVSHKPSGICGYSKRGKRVEFCIVRHQAFILEVVPAEGGLVNTVAKCLCLINSSDKQTIDVLDSGLGAGEASATQPLCQLCRCK